MTLHLDKIPHLQPVICFLSEHLWGKMAGHYPINKTWLWVNGRCCMRCNKQEYDIVTEEFFREEEFFHE